MRRTFLSPMKFGNSLIHIFSTELLPRLTITGNSLEVTTLIQFFFPLSYAVLFAHYREQANSETSDHVSRAYCYCGNQSERDVNRAFRAQKQTLLRVLYNVKTLTQLWYFSFYANLRRPPVFQMQKVENKTRLIYG
jgi:hypothetical protein